MPEAIAGVVAVHPGLRVVTVEGSFETLAASLRAGDIDFILGALRPADFASDLSGLPLGEDDSRSSRVANILGRIESASHRQTSRVHVGYCRA